MVGSGIPALSLFLLMQGSVGEVADIRGREPRGGPPQPPYSTSDTISFLSQMEMESRDFSIHGVSSG